MAGHGKDLLIWSSCSILLEEYRWETVFTVNLELKLYGNNIPVKYSYRKYIVGDILSGVGR